jgi:hypothetical protein
MASNTTALMVNFLNPSVVFDIFLILSHIRWPKELVSIEINEIVTLIEERTLVLLRHVILVKDRMVRLVLWRGRERQLTRLDFVQISASFVLLLLTFMWVPSFLILG